MTRRRFVGAVGGLTSPLNVSKSRPVSFPTFPGTGPYLLNQYITSQDQPAPTVPSQQTLPTQEPGSRRKTTG